MLFWLTKMLNGKKKKRFDFDGHAYVYPFFFSGSRILLKLKKWVHGVYLRVHSTTRLMRGVIWTQVKCQLLTRNKITYNLPSRELSMFEPGNSWNTKANTDLYQRDGDSWITHLVLHALWMISYKNSVRSENTILWRSIEGWVICSCLFDRCIEINGRLCSFYIGIRQISIWMFKQILRHTYL